MKRGYVIILLFLHAAVCSAKGDIKTPLKNLPFTAPFTIIHGLMLINVEVGGKNGFFMIDTGNELNFVNTQYLEKNIIHRTSHKRLPTILFMD